MTPIVNGLQTTYAGRVQFQQLNVATPAGAQAQQRYQLRGHPAYALVDSQGQVSWQAIGQLPEEELLRQVEELFLEDN